MIQNTRLSIKLIWQKQKKWGGQLMINTCTFYAIENEWRDSFSAVFPKEINILNSITTY